MEWRSQKMGQPRDSCYKWSGEARKWVNHVTVVTNGMEERTKWVNHVTVVTNGVEEPTKWVNHVTIVTNGVEECTCVSPSAAQQSPIQRSLQASHVWRCITTVRKCQSLFKHSCQKLSMLCCNFHTIILFA